MQVIVQVPVTAFGIWFANESCGFHVTEVDAVFETIVPVALPKAYVSVWVNEEDAREICITDAFPNSAFEAVTEDALGIESRVTVVFAVMES